MRFTRFMDAGREGLAVRTDDGLVGYRIDEAGYPGDFDTLCGGNLTALAETLKSGNAVPDTAELLPPLVRPPKIVCLGLNYADHAAEGGFEPPPYPTVFARFPSSLIGHQAPLVCPKVSTAFDFEGEMVAVIGKAGRHIARADALGHVAGYSVFNDASVRDYQTKTPQWTVGKNFDGTGAFGPDFVTPDELPDGGAGLKIETRLNGTVVQSSNTSLMIFDVVETIALLSEAFTLEVGDVLVMGTPSGVGVARKPPLFMKPGDVCEVEIEKIGLLRNTVVAE